jgi:septal ring factor EnvC (AmiA/AmiB activator)
MDPLSITAGCIGIISTIAKTSTSITLFVRNVRDSRRELTETKQQLAELEMTLNLINDDHNRENGRLAQQMPEGIAEQTKLVLHSCQDILVELDALITKYNSERRRTAFQWARKGKEEVTALNKQLEAHARTLHMLLEFSTL